MDKDPSDEAVPSLDPASDGEERTETFRFSLPPAAKRPFLVRLSGVNVGKAHPVDAPVIMLGRGATCDVCVDEHGVSRTHARITRVDGGAYVIEDLGSSNGTQLNGRRLVGIEPLRDGDQILMGSDTVIKFAFFDAVEERYHSFVHDVVTKTDLAPISATQPLPWSPSSWRSKPVAQDVKYDDAEELTQVLTKLRRLPPLVTSWEVEDLKRLIAEAQQGRRFLLQGGDCAETHDDCAPDVITNKLKIVIQMSLVLIRGLRRPVIRVGRFAGQYAKPRSKPTETRDGVELPSYFGDLVNRPAFTPEARRPDPQLLLASYYHASVTLNFIRALSAGGFADLRRSEYYDLSFSQAELPSTLKHDYAQMSRELSGGLEFLRSFGDRAVDELMRVNFYASHEGLSLPYEEAQTRLPPRRSQHYDLTTHMPWIGERTRALDGAHIEFFRGIANPVAVKVGPTAAREEVVELCRALNPQNEYGKLVLITRMGAKNVGEKLPGIVNAVRRSGARVLWVSDPMHGNAITTRANIKTRDFEDILREVDVSIEVHRELGTYLGGVHFELTGEDVTECIGGGLSESDLTRRYATMCDPRLNYRQALQMAFAISRRLGTLPAPASSIPPAPRSWR